MKKLLVLAGGSLRNKAWGEGCAEFFKKDFDMTFFIHYDHWESGESNLDFDVELKKITETVKGAGEEGEWYVYAKSIGSILTLKAVQAGAIAPAKCVFFGMPFSVVADSLFKDDWSALESFRVPSLAFHNDDDPTANYEFTKEKLSALAPAVALITLSGNTHDYLDFSSYESPIKTFIHE